MVTLHVAGNKIGTLADAPVLIAEFIKKNDPIEFRDESGELVGNFFPVHTENVPRPVIEWEPGLTREEIERRKVGPVVTFDEMKKMLGWE